MAYLGNVALECLTWLWVVQSGLSVVKTRQAHRKFVAHRRWLERAMQATKPRRAAWVISVKGDSENFDPFLDFVLGQDYPDYRVIFVTESEQDPATPRIRQRLAESPKGRLIIAGEASASGQKVHNLLAALATLEPEDQILAFADADLMGRSDWLSCLALPLNQGRADFTTGYRWFVPQGPSLPNRIVAQIGAGIEPWIGPNWRMCLWGGSMAMTREMHDELHLSDELKGCINDDVRISQIAKRAGKKMSYVRSVAALSPVDFNWRSLFEFGRRQYFQLRIYQNFLWWMAFCIPWFYLAGLAVCLIRLSAGQFLMLAPLAAVVVLTGCRNATREMYISDRFASDDERFAMASMRGGGWLDPLVHLVHGLIIASSAVGREMVWAGIRYRITGPKSTVILARPKDDSPASISETGSALARPVPPEKIPR